MNKFDIKQLQALTAPFSISGAHVQGPGGNTSVKTGDDILIKASGYTFTDVAEGRGIVLLHNAEILNNLNLKAKHKFGEPEINTPEILSSIPENLRPSMEFEFHSILNKFVLHTHCVYANVITCCTMCKEILCSIFSKDEYLLVPYVTPGTPIATYLLSGANTLPLPKIIFLKNHGVIVHGDDLADVIDTYNKMEIKIRSSLQLPSLQGVGIARTPNGDVIDSNQLDTFCGDLTDTGQLLTHEILIPDQSIFFKDKVQYSEPTRQCLFIDSEARSIAIIGSDKFRQAGKEMLLAVYYIRNQLARLGMNPDYISPEKISEMHRLDSEKYRSHILKN